MPLGDDFLSVEEFLLNALNLHQTVIVAFYKISIVVADDVVILNEWSWNGCHDACK